MELLGSTQHVSLTYRVISNYAFREVGMKIPSFKTGNSNASDNVGSRIKFRGADNVTPYSNAVTENGENWSMGQRQLVLALDEATASVNPATDNVIQQTLTATLFRLHSRNSCTSLNICHCHGLVKEYDSPLKLLENESSSFAQVVEEYTVRSISSFEK